MRSKGFARLLNIFVAAIMVVPVLPAAMFATASVPAALPPSPEYTLDEIVQPLSPMDVVSPTSAPSNPPAGSVQVPDNEIYAPLDPTVLPAVTPGSPETQRNLRQWAFAQLRDTVANEADLDLPLLQFLAKYPSFKSTFADLTGIASLGAPVYSFTPDDEALIYARLRLQEHPAPFGGVLIPGAALSGSSARTPMAVGTVLVIDDDGSANNGGPSVIGWPWTNQTALVTASLTNASVTWDLYVRPYLGDFPDFQTLSNYQQVVYVGGQNLNLYGTAAYRRLQAYLEAEGDLWVVGQFSVYAVAGVLNTTTGQAGYPDFLRDFYGIASFVSWGTATPMNGTGGEYLTGRQYTFTRTMRENITTALGADTRFLDYSSSLNVTASASAVTTGDALDRSNISRATVVNNARQHAAGQGIVVVSPFEFNYFDTSAQRDDFVNRTITQLGTTSGMTYDATTDIAAVGMRVYPSITEWDGRGFEAYSGTTGGFLGYFYFYAAWVERGQPAHVDLTIENFRNAAFNADPKILMQGDGTINLVTLVDNSTYVAAGINIPARGKVNVTLDFVPHRMRIMDGSGIVAVTNSDTSANSNNDWLMSSVGVAGYYDGAETAKATTVANGFTRVQNTANAHSGDWYWFTGSGNNLNNTLTFPWIDLRYLNGTGPGNRSVWFIEDQLFFLTWIYGDVSSPDCFWVEERNESSMTWVSMYVDASGNPSCIQIATRPTPSDPLQYYSNFDQYNLNGGQLIMVALGAGLPEFAGNQFLQMRFRYVTGGTSSSTGYRVDGIGWHAMSEQNAPVDFHPLFTNSILAPPRYTVMKGPTVIGTGVASPGTIIDVNETETVTMASYIQDPQGDSFTYAWSQSVAGAATLPAAGATPIGFANLSWTYTTDLNTFEQIRAGSGGGNQVSFTLTATDELNKVNSTSWTIRVRDAPPVWNPSAPTSFSIDEDTMACYQATGISEWFSDPQTDPYTLFGTSPVVNASQTVTLIDNRLTNGTVCLRASSADWHGLTNITISATDNKSSIATNKLNVTILPVNDAPRVPLGETDRLNATAGFRQNVYASINVTLFDVDDPQAALTPTVVSNPPGVWTEGRNATGNLWLYAVRPGNEMASNNYFNVTVCDPHGACVPLRFVIFIANTNDPPQWVSVAQPRYADQGVEFREQFLASDPDDLVPGESPTVFIWTDDTQLFEINSTGWVIFTPTNDQVGTQSVTLRVSDGTATAPLTFTMTVNNTNDPPQLPPYADINVSQDQLANPPLIKASDPDLALWNKLPTGQLEDLAYTDDCPLFVIERVDQPSSIPGAPPEPAGRIRFTPGNDQVGVWTCTVTVTDRGLLTDSVTFRIFVNNVNDSPTGVHINITDDGGVVRPVTVSDTKVSYNQDQALHMNIYADDPDLRFRVNDPTVRVNPSEALSCSILSQFTSSLDVAPSSPAKPLFAGDTSTSDYDPVNGCEIDFTPTNNEVGLFTITVTIRDASQTSITFKLKLEVKNINDAPTNLKIVSPAASFTVDATGTLSLSGTAVDVDTAESGLTYSWTVEIVGGAKYTASQKSAQVALNNPDSGDKQVHVTLKVTDNLDAANPIEREISVNGTIKGKATQPGFELPAVLIGMSLVAAVLVASRRRREE